MGQVIRSAWQLGAELSSARRARNLTQQELADLSGTGQKTISKIESGAEGTKLETIFTLLAALDFEITLAPRSKGIPVEDFFDGFGRPSVDADNSESEG